MTTNCDKNLYYIKRADIIWGPAESVLEGKMEKTNKHNRIPKPTLPLSVSELH